MSSFDSKSLLAKLMATENLYVQEAKVPTASFDVLNRVLTIPILDDKLSSDLYDLFIGHEVGHALYTPVEEMKKAKDDGVHMSILNVVEDCRIERKVKYKYPGLKNCFVKAYSELFEKDFFETEGKNLQELNFIDRMNLHHKIGPILGIKFTEFERELVRDVEACETYTEAIVMAKKIAEYMKEELEKKQEEQQKIKVAVIVDDDGNESGDQSAEGEDSLDDFDVVIDARGQNSDEEEEKSEQKNEGSSKNASGSDGDDGETEETDEPAENSSNKPSNGLEGTMGGNKNGIGEQLKSFTDEAFKRNEDRLHSKEIRNIVYASVPKFDTDKIYDYKKLYADYIEERGSLNFKHFMKFKKESNKVVSYLVKEFELRKNASQLKRASTAKTGELNMNKIYSYNFNEDIFKKISVMPDGKSHGLIMYLDWSGSMVNHIGNTIKQLLNLALFCRKVNIPFEVYSFIEETKEEYMCQFDLKAGDLAPYRFGLLNILSSRMNNKDFTIASTVLMDIAGVGVYSRAGITPYWLRMSGTPLNEAIMSAMEIVPEFQKRNRLQIVNTVFLTDGEGQYLSNIHQGRLGYNSTALNSRKNEYVVLRDNKTRREERYTYNYGGSVSLEQSNALIRLLKHRTNSHVIGFYVTNTSEFKNKIRHFYDVMQGDTSFVDYDKVEDIKKEFVKNKYAITTKTGFDDYYILRSNGLDTEDDAELEIKENATTRGMVSAFTKFAGNRVNNRVILNRFISWIS